MLGDEGVQRDAIDAMIGDVRVDIADFSVEVQTGRFYLRGIVPSVFQRAIADEIAQRIKGVNQVINEKRVAQVPRRADEDVAAGVRTALRLDPRVQEPAVIVGVKDRIVYLNGAVGTEAEKAAAEDDARLLQGVNDIVNGIVIAPEQARDDAALAGEVRAAILAETLLGPSEIEVEVTRGVVHLHGSVWSPEESQQVE